MDPRLLNDVSSGLQNIVGSMTDFNAAAKMAGAGNAEYTAKVLQLENALRDMTSKMQASRMGLDAFSARFKENRKVVAEAWREVDQYVARQKILAVQNKAVEFATAGMTKKIHMSTQAMQKLGSAMGTVADKLSTSRHKLGDVKGALLEYNRAMFESSRYAQLLGRSPMFDETAWSALQKNITMSRTEFLQLHKSMQEIWLGVPPGMESLSQMATQIQERFGYTNKVMDDVTRRFATVQEAIPGVVTEIQKLNAANQQMDPQRARELALAYEQAGLQIREIATMELFQTDTTEQQKQMMLFEKAVESRNQAIADANVKMGKNAETVMIAMERALGGAVRVVDKLVNSFKIVPPLMIAMKTIGMSNLAALTGQVRQLAAAWGAVNAEATGAAGSQRAAGTVPVGGGPQGRMAGFRGAGGMMSAMAVAAAATAVVSQLMSAREAESRLRLPGIKPEEAYLARMEARGSKRGAALTGGGAVIGGAIGTAIAPGIGTAIGLGVGSAVGYGANMLFGPDAAEKERMSRSLRALGTVRERGDFKQGINVKFDELTAEKDILRTVKEQATARQRVMAINALIKMEAYTEDELRKKIGGSIMKEYDAVMKVNRENQKGTETHYRQLRGWMETEKQLQKIYDLASKINQMYASMGSSARDVAGGWALAGFAAEKAAIAAEAQVEAAEKAVNALNKYMQQGGEAPASVTTGMEKRLSETFGLDGGQARELAKIASDVAVASSRNDADALAKAKAKFNERAKALGVDEKIADVLKQINGTLSETLAKQLKLTNQHLMVQKFNQMNESSMKAANSRLDVATIAGESIVRTLDKETALRRVNTELMEASAAGFAYSIEGHRKEYQLLGLKRKQLEANRDAIDQSTAGTMKMLYARRDLSAQLEKYGITQQMATKAAQGDVRARDEFNRRMAQGLRQEGANGTSLLRINQEVTQTLERRLDYETQIKQTQLEQVKLAMALREGYLDVIDEMTTGGDLISKLLPDAQRGIVSLHEMRAMATGADTAGALKRGFVSVTPFAADMQRANLPRYTAAGFSGGDRSGVLQRHMNILLEEEKRQNKLGLGMYGNVPGKEISKSTILAGEPPKNLNANTLDAKVQHATLTVTGYLETSGKAGQSGLMEGAPNLPIKPGYGKSGGGLIPGAPSDRDNTMGVLNGRPIGLASGEFVVNARATQRHRGLLEAINSSESVSSSPYGLQGGGSWFGWAGWDAETQSAVGRSIGSGWRGFTSGYNRAVEGAASALHPLMWIGGLDRLNEINDTREASKKQFAANKKQAAIRATKAEEAAQVAHEKNRWNSMTGQMNEYFRLRPWARKSVHALAASRDMGGPYTTQFMDAFVAYRKQQDAREEKVSSKDLRRYLKLKGLTPADAIKKYAGEGFTPREAKQRFLIETSRSSGYAGWQEAQKSIARMEEPERERKLWEKAAAPEPAQMVTRTVYGQNGPRQVRREKRERGIYIDGQLQEGFAAGGMPNPYGLSAAQALTIAGGMRIGTLNLNGKTIGQDVSGGMGDEWKAAMKDAYG